MFGLKLFCLCALLNVVCCEVEFPSWFKFGVASSAYQIEGAWNVSDKSESVWDKFLHNEQALSSEPVDNGDVATDSYHLWRRDVEMLDELGVQFYRFSISWSRLLPQGFDYYISEDGSRYYSELIDALLEKGIEPVVTLYHWDLPQGLQDLGGWTNPLIADWFADYSRVVFSLFGDRVKTWITINEPVNMCDYFYNLGTLAPGVQEPVYSGYLCDKHVLLAHAKAWRVYDEEFRRMYGGKISICNHLLWLKPAAQEYKKITKRALEIINGRYLTPIFSKQGGWPRYIVNVIDEYSKSQGYTHSRLPELTNEERKLIRGTYDFFGVNYYTTRLVRPATPEDQDSLSYLEYVRELGAVLEVDPEWDSQPGVLGAVYPNGLREVLAWVKKSYGDMEVFITESGYSEEAEEDEGRIQFIQDNLEQLLLSINEDKVNVTGYTYWSLMDNYEWISGYGEKYGLYQVDFSSPNLTRTPRKSAEYYSTIIQDRSL